MATTNSPEQTERTNRIAVGVLLALLAVGGAAVVFAYLSRPPQMGTSEEAFHTVDALYTAVRNRDEKRVTECAQRLEGYRRSGQLPANAADELARIVTKAKDGSWESATERLYDFMLAQKREGEIARAPKPTHKKTK